MKIARSTIMHLKYPLLMSQSTLCPSLSTPSSTAAYEKTRCTRHDLCWAQVAGTTWSCYQGTRTRRWKFQVPDGVRQPISPQPQGTNAK